MPLALGTAAIVSMVLLAVLLVPSLRRSGLAPREWAARHRVHRRPGASIAAYDPGRELRAEQRARALLRSCLNEDEWAMYCELGFLRVHGGIGEPPCAYLVYPHRPILAFALATSSVLGEYCVEFPDRTRPYGSERLPDADDVLAKWVALTADEQGLIEQANLHLPGRQIRIAKARRDLARLAQWDRERACTGGQEAPRVSSVPAL